MRSVELSSSSPAQFLFSPYSSGLTAAAAVITEQNGKIMVDSGGAEEKPFERAHVPGHQFGGHEAPMA